MTFELFGVVRLRAGIGRTEIDAATVGEALGALAERFPALVDAVVVNDSVRPAYRLSLNGESFVTDPTTPLASDDCLLLLSADVGG